MRCFIGLAVTIFAAAMGVISFAVGAKADPPSAPQYAGGHHGHGHAEYHEWYATLHDKHGRSCCNNMDCRPTEHRIVGEQVEVMLDGQWTPVPREKILDKNSPDMGTHVCAPDPHIGYPRGYIYCVVIGSGV
jgi:hypothetical protein